MARVHLRMNTGLCMVTTLRAPEEEAIPFVHYHLNVGIEHMFLFFDDPNDAVAELFAEDSRVTSFLCDAEYWARLGQTHANWIEGFDGTRPILIEHRQHLNSIVALARARERNFRWIAHIDGDEFLYAPCGLAALLGEMESSVDFVRFKVLEGVAKDIGDNTPMQTIELFKIVETRAWSDNARSTIGSKGLVYIKEIVNGFRRFAAGFTSARHIFAERGLVVGHSQGKSFVRTASPVSYLRCHKPVATVGAKLRCVTAQRAYLLHFDCWNFDKWYSKWARRIDGSGTAGMLSPRRQKQFAEFRALWSLDASDEMHRLYEKQCLIPKRALFALRRLRFLKRIKLPASLFAASIDAHTINPAHLRVENVPDACK